MREAILFKERGKPGLGGFFYSRRGQGTLRSDHCRKRRKLGEGLLIGKRKFFSSSKDRRKGTWNTHLSPGGGRFFFFSNRNGKRPGQLRKEKSDLWKSRKRTVETPPREKKKIFAWREGKSWEGSP